MIKQFRNTILVGIIIILAIVLRFWQLGKIPASPDWDEAATGYNAYSILRIGKDEFGSFLPLSFRSFNDYKPPLYVYLTVPSVLLFGLTVWAVRLPSAIFGVLAVLGTYFLIEMLIRHAKDTSEDKSVILGLPPDVLDALPFIAALGLAISPWHIQFSRVAFEANIGLTLNIWAAYFFLRGFYNRSGLTVSAILFAIALYAYHSERVFVPCLVLFLLVVYKKYLFPEKIKSVVTALIVGLIIALPLIPVVLNKSALARFNGSSIFNQQTELLSQTVSKLAYDNAHSDLLGKIFDNRRVEYAKILIRNYLVHFSPNWLFLTGDLERHHAPDMGLLYIWELPFILIGIFRLLRSKGSDNKFFLGWLLLAPIAAAPTVPTPHAVRTLVFLPSYQVFTSIGLLASFSWVKGRWQRWKIPFMLGICVIITGSFIYYVHMYFVHTNIEYSQFWQYGYKEAVTYTEAHKSKYDKVVVSTSLEESYIFFLFYTKYDPASYLAEGGTKLDIPNMNTTFDKYEFRPIHLAEEKTDGTILYVLSPLDLSSGNLKNITFLNGQTAIVLTDRPFKP